MKHYCVYVDNRGLGQILWHGQCQDNMVSQQADSSKNQKAIELSAPLPQTEQYLDGTTPKPRPATTCTASASTVPADGASTITLSGLAANTQIDIAGPVSSSFVNSAASEDLTFGASGEYTITATGPFPSLPTTVNVSAT